MQIYNSNLSFHETMPNWLTIQEAVEVSKELTNQKITESEIFRHALRGTISLSIYFQSPFILMKVNTSNRKVKLRSIDNSFIHRLCMLEKNCFINDRNLVFSTNGTLIYPTKRVIDTSLTGHEYVIIQNLLAHSLRLPLPIIGANYINFGITVSMNGDIYQVYEENTWRERIKSQVIKLQESYSKEINQHIFSLDLGRYVHRDFFPVHELPQDACFVIRYAELEKLIGFYTKSKTSLSSETRISTPLSRLFWLACKHNDAISPLLRHPYKLLSIFEQWASDDGITDHLSAETLKNALKRGSPSSPSSSH